MNFTPLHIGLVAIGLGFLIEAFLYLPGGFWNSRRKLAWLALVLNTFGSGVFIAEGLLPLSMAFLLLTIYRTLNILRIYRTVIVAEYHLKNTLRRNFWYLAATQLLIIALWAVNSQFDITFYNERVYQVVGLAFMLVGLKLLVGTIINIVKSKPKKYANLSNEKLPTLTIAIPARNEDEQLKECLEATLASDYPKMEILVYDDCSQDKTVDIIKNFAKDGVRFIKGEEAKEPWLSKNLACQKLLEEASGELILYVGVDARLSITTVRRLVEYLEFNKLEMLSVLPKRYRGGFMAAFIQPMRYWWEMALPRWLSKQPPVLSTCYLIKRQALLKMGSFKSVTHAIIPEEHLARQAHMSKVYAFIRSNSVIGLYTQKTYIEQWSTAVRTRYPQAHKQPAVVAAKTLLMLIFLLLPFITFVMALITTAPVVIILFNGLACLALITSHVLITYISNPAAIYFAFINFPIVVMLDIIAMHVSMYRYEFGEVIWKGRNVSKPIMHIYQHLPKI